MSGWTHHLSVTGCKTQVDEPTKSELQGKIENLDQHNESSPSKFSGSSLYLSSLFHAGEGALTNSTQRTFDALKL